MAKKTENELPEPFDSYLDHLAALLSAQGLDEDTMNDTVDRVEETLVEALGDSE